MAKKARKWSNLQGRVPEAQVEVSERELKIRAEADRLRFEKKTMKDLALEYQNLAEEEEFEDKAHKIRSIQYEALERVMLDELTRVQEISGQDMWRGEHQTFSPQFSVIPIVEDKAKLLKWIKETGQEDYLLDIAGGRLKEVIAAAMNTDEAAALTPAERAALKPGEPASGQPPPGVKVYLKKGVHRSTW